EAMRVVAVLTMMVGLVLPAAAADYPIGAQTLKFRARASGATLTFVTRDASAPFPAIGSADDPANGTPGGVVVELFSSNNGTGSMNVPAGLGKPGWQAKLATVSQYKFTNSSAPSGI